jgi:hypothetical protein
MTTDITQDKEKSPEKYVKKLNEIFFRIKSKNTIDEESKHIEIIKIKSLIELFSKKEKLESLKVFKDWSKQIGSVRSILFFLGLNESEVKVIATEINRRLGEK